MGIAPLKEQPPKAEFVAMRQPGPAYPAAGSGRVTAAPAQQAGAPARADFIRYMCVFFFVLHYIYVKINVFYCELVCTLLF